MSASSVALTGCDDGFEPLVWADRPDTVELYSLARPDYVDRPAAYSIVFGSQPLVTVERLNINPFAFDFAVTEDEEGNFLLLPAGIFPDNSSRPGIIVDSTATFQGIQRAPRDGYTIDEPVVAETGVVYVIRSRQSPNQCLYYGKMEILELDPAGVVTLRILSNLNCSDRSLVPNAPVTDEDDGEEGGG